MLEKDGEDQLDQSCGKWMVTKSKGGEEYPTDYKLPSKNTLLKER